jgi:hypothetical protein
MAETERDEKVSAGYRALGSEEPPRALDEAILALARERPTRWRVPPTRWRVPLSIAAVLVLAVGVTLRMLPERPDTESIALAPQVMQTPRPAVRAQPKAAARAEAAADVAAASTAPSPVAQEKVQSEVRAAAPARPAAAPATAGAAMGLSVAPLTPEAWLARIAELRKQGRTREADESLVEFRKRYPDYKIPESLR